MKENWTTLLLLAMKENWTTLFLELREEDLCKFSGKFKFCWKRLNFSVGHTRSVALIVALITIQPHKQLKPVSKLNILYQVNFFSI